MGKPLNPPAFFQPICLTFFVLKLLERIMLSRLFFFRESNSIPSPRRAGFRLVGLFSVQFCSFLSSFRMSLTSTARAQGRFLPRSTFLKLSTLSGIHLFSTNLFWLAFFLALYIELNFSFLIGACVAFQNHKSRFFRAHRAILRSVSFSLSINDLPASLPSSVSCSLCANNLAICSFSPSVPAAVEAIQCALI